MASAPINSRKAFYNKILELLKDGGDDGLHVDDLVYLVGCEKKELIPRLKELNGRGEIKEVDKGRWKKKIAADANGNGDVSEGLVKIHLPGDLKFSSYKNSLQEYCQKKSLPVPKYNSTHEGTYLIGFVSFGNSVVKCDKPCANVKEADALAAFEALKQLGYFSKETAFTNTTELNQLKRKATVSNSDTPQILAKDGVTHKSKLNEYAMKQKLPAPTYDTVAVDDGFFSTVLVNNKQFKGNSTCKKRKEAEQSAAQVALNALIGIPMSCAEKMVIGEDDVTKMISEARQASQPTPYKSRLQEYCVKHGQPLPLYSTQALPSDNQQYQCTVTVCGNEYTGQFTRGKKAAEARAAEEALNALTSTT